MKPWLRRLSQALAYSSYWPGSNEFHLPGIAAPRPFKALLVVAHPDDESECAGTLYRLTHEGNAIVDQVAVTDGGGGQQYTAPALRYYGVTGRPDVAKQLPRLRRKELRKAGRILGIRRQHWLGQKDNGFTLDPGDGLQTWNLPYVRSTLYTLMERERYDIVLMLLPTPDSHGHHQTVAALVMEAAARLPVAHRPAVLGVRAGSSPGTFEGQLGFPQSRSTSPHPVWSFDRRMPLALNSALDHTIIVHWVIAEHKSQGKFQMEYGKHTHEYFWQFVTGNEHAQSPWQPVLQSIAVQRRFDGASQAHPLSRQHPAPAPTIATAVSNPVIPIDTRSPA